MNLKTIINPKKFINSLPTKPSWSLFIFIAIIFLIEKIFLYFILGDEFLKEYIDLISPVPADHATTFIVLFSLWVMSLRTLGLIIIEAIIASFVIQRVLWFFKKDIGFFKLINIFLYAHLASKFIVLLNSLITFSGKNNVTVYKNFLLKKMEGESFLLVMFNSGNFLHLLLFLLSSILLFVLLIYGIKISIKNKITLIK